MNNVHLCKQRFLAVEPAIPLLVRVGLTGSNWARFAAVEVLTDILWWLSDVYSAPWRPALGVVLDRFLIGGGLDVVALADDATLPGFVRHAAVELGEALAAAQAAARAPS